MRPLIALVALCITHTAHAADPACLDAVHAQFDAVVQQTTDDEAAILFDVVDLGEVAQESCEGPAEEYSNDGYATIQAPPSACAGLEDTVRALAQMMGQLARVAQACHESPACGPDQEAKIVSAIANVNKSIAAIVQTMAKLGC